MEGDRNILKEYRRRNIGQAIALWIIVLTAIAIPIATGRLIIKTIMNPKFNNYKEFNQKDFQSKGFFK